MSEKYKLFGLLGSLLVLLVLINSTIHVLESKASLAAQILEDPQTVTAIPAPTDSSSTLPAATSPSAPTPAPVPTNPPDVASAPVTSPTPTTPSTTTSSSASSETTPPDAAPIPATSPATPTSLPPSTVIPAPVVPEPVPLAPLAPLSPPAPSSESNQQPATSSGGSIVITPSPAPSIAPTPAPAPSAPPVSEIPAPVTVAPPTTEPLSSPVTPESVPTSSGSSPPSLLTVPLSPIQIVDQIADELQKRNLACKDAEGRKDVMVNDKVFADAVQVTSRVGKNACPDSCKAEIFFDLDPSQQRKGLCRKIESSCYDGGDDGIKFSSFESCEAYYQTRVFSGDFQSRKEDEDFKKAKKDMKEKYTESKNTCIIQAAILCKNNDKENLQKCLRQNVLPCFDWDAYLNSIEPIKSFDALSELGNKVLQWRNESGR